MIKRVSEESDSVEDDDWGNPPSPYTAENRKKALRAQLIIGFFAFIGILLPGLLLWLSK